MAASTQEMTVLDLPELTLEIILAKVAPSGPCSMASDCTSLRDRCRSDRPPVGEAHEGEMGDGHRQDGVEGVGVVHGIKKGAYRSKNGLVGSWLKPRKAAAAAAAAVESVMARYLALESGRFWFPAQVYNREVPTTWAEACERRGRSEVGETESSARGYSSIQSPCLELLK